MGNYSESAALKADEPRSEVQEQINECELALSRGCEIQKEVEGRLISVLRNEETKEKEAQDPEEALVPLADSLRNICENIERLNCGYKDILERLRL